MNAILIPSFQQNGAAIASVASELAVCVYQFTMAHNLVHTRFHLTDILKMLIASGCMAISVSLIVYCVDSMFVSIIMSCIIGVIVYIGMTVLLHVTTSVFVLRHLKAFLKRG